MPDAATLIHLAVHLVAPGVVAFVAFRRRWPAAWGWMLATMVVDLDHLAADPVHDPERCGIGFHPLHSWPAIGVYALLLFAAATRVIASGLLVHMGADGLDCLRIAAG